MKRNPVAKHAPQFQKSVVMKDRKKASKRGEAKHRKNRFRPDHLLPESRFVFPVYAFAC